MINSKITLLDIADNEDKSSPLANRIRKNYRHLKKWAKRTQTDCFRIYDKDMREFPIAIDFYAGRFCVHYFAKSTEGDEGQIAIEIEKATLNAIQIVFGSEIKEVYWRTRERNKETRQYEKVRATQEFFTVYEYGVKFKVNLLDYLDTGLFLDHRETRKMVASISSGKRLLNLFSYTGSFSVHAALAGASFTKSVDMSNTYSNWARENFTLNQLSSIRNEVVRADCLKFLDDELISNRKYDIIIIDPPTISRSKKMHKLFDIQLDYITLISKSLKLLLPKGLLYFSTNSRKFNFDTSIFSKVSIKEISHQTLPIDFQDPKIHRCWKIGYE